MEERRGEVGGDDEPDQRDGREHKIQLYETPVGFKYIGELIIKDEIAIGGEESAGLTIRGHVPEKDGVIAGLLIAEMVAHSRQEYRRATQRAICQSWFLLPGSRELPLDS